MSEDQLVEGIEAIVDRIEAIVDELGAVPEDWLVMGIEAIGETLAGIEMIGASGGAVPLFTADEATARARAAALAATYAALPDARGHINAGTVCLDTDDDPPQYRTPFYCEPLAKK